jgi:hypothetical protein
VYRAYGVVKPRMVRPGIYQIRKSQLLYPAQALKIPVFYDAEYPVDRNADKAIDRVIENLNFAQHVLFMAVGG